MDTALSTYKFYDLLKAKLGLNEAEAFMQILHSEVERKLDEKTTVFATKEDIARLENRISTLETKIAESKVDMINWMVVTAIASYGIMMASMKFFFHL